jgi:hypothetical protein
MANINLDHKCKRCKNPLGITQKSEASTVIFVEPCVQCIRDKAKAIIAAKIERLRGELELDDNMGTQEPGV